MLPKWKLTGLYVQQITLKRLKQYTSKVISKQVG